MSTNDLNPAPSRAAAALLEQAIAAKTFPAAAAEVGDSATVLWREARGTLTFDRDAPDACAETIFDLASLTKPIATTTVVLDLIDRGLLALEDPVSSYFTEWIGRDRESVTIQDLLEHASGLPARLLDRPPEVAREFEHDICAMPLEYAPRTRSLYSDLDFILLGFLATARGQATLAAQFAGIVARLASAWPTGDPPALMFGVPAAQQTLVAPTLPLDDDLRRGRRLVGEVHDNYAAALGGIAGHAGLFGTAGAVGAFARAVLRSARGDSALPAPLSPEIVARAIRRSTVPGSSRALGWDTMLPTSSCGTRLSSAAFGHAGFTGTSIWIDPKRDRYFVLLTNRVCGGGTSEEMQQVRRTFHDALSEL